MSRRYPTEAFNTFQNSGGASQPPPNFAAPGSGGAFPAPAPAPVAYPPQSPAPQFPDPHSPFTMQQQPPQFTASSSAPPQQYAAAPQQPQYSAPPQQPQYQQSPPLTQQQYQQPPPAQQQQQQQQQYQQPPPPPQQQQQYQQALQYQPYGSGGGGRTASSLESSMGQIPNANVGQVTNAMSGLTLESPPEPSAQSPPEFMRLTSYAIPQARDVLEKSGIPLACIVQPIVERANVPLVPLSSQFPDIMRCRKCRAYVNPFMTFLDGGQRFCCNLCRTQNDVPPAYRAPLGADGRRIDAAARPELSCGTVEFVAPEQYSVRPPPPPTYFFVLDTSAPAVQGGALAAACEAIRVAIRRLSDERARVGLLTVDSHVTFYRFRKNSDGEYAPHVLVLPDVDNLFLPCSPTELLVHASSALTCLEGLLEALPQWAKRAGGSKAHFDPECAFGAALKAAWNVLRASGGRLVPVLARLPSLGAGALRPRDDPSFLGTDKEIALCSVEEPFYDEFASDCAKHQIAVSIFLLARGYQDVATLSRLAAHSSGHVFHYPGFSPTNDGTRLRRDVRALLRAETGFEAVMRLRLSEGLAPAPGGAIGNFAVRSTDLLALPCVDAAHAYTFPFKLASGGLAALKMHRFVSFQSALLYTTQRGERRIRVSNLCVPLTTHVSEVMRAADAPAVAAVLAKQLLKGLPERETLAAARERLYEQLIKIGRCWRRSGAASSSSSSMGSTPSSAAGMAPAYFPEGLAQLPLLICGLLRHTALARAEVRPDDRAMALATSQRLPLEEWTLQMYPRMYRLLPLLSARWEGMLTGTTPGAEEEEDAAHDDDDDDDDEKSEKGEKEEGEGEMSGSGKAARRRKVGKSAPKLAAVIGRPRRRQRGGAGGNDGRHGNGSGSGNGNGNGNDDSPLAACPPVPLSVRALERNGVFLLDSGNFLFLWLGKYLAPELVDALLGGNNLYAADVRPQRMAERGNPVSQALFEVVREVRARHWGFLRLFILREGDAMEGKFFSLFVDDKSKFMPASAEFLNKVRQAIDADA